MMSLQLSASHQQRLFPPTGRYLSSSRAIQHALKIPSFSVWFVGVEWGSGGVVLCWGSISDLQHN
jgi:hypothetical protein